MKKILTKDYLKERYKKVEISLDTISKEELYSYLAPTLNSEELETITFSFLFVSKVENLITRVLNGIFKIFIKNDFKNTKEVNQLIGLTISELHFRGKIKILKENSFPRYKKFIAFSDKINTLRNDLAHGKFKNLMYGKDKILMRQTKQKMIDDLHSTAMIALDGAEVEDRDK
ncbi:MAG: hypothetical protein AAB534_00830 [Patescibacteria group bacterium]